MVFLLVFKIFVIGSDFQNVFRFQMCLNFKFV
jgi:hypothetical protein